MKIADRCTVEKQTVDLLTAVGIYHSQEIVTSMSECLGSVSTLSRWELEEINDALLSMVNDTD